MGLPVSMQEVRQIFLFLVSRAATFFTHHFNNFGLASGLERTLRYNTSSNLTSYGIALPQQANNTVLLIMDSP